MSETRRPVADDELRRHGGLREPLSGYAASTRTGQNRYPIKDLETP
jgi:hypothetical protein